MNLNPPAFIRVHKSYIVSIPKIEAIENNDILIQASRIPISRNHRDAVLERVVSKKLWLKSGED
jgi:DNA-binding LytR/AlgR family response regulator